MTPQFRVECDADHDAVKDLIVRLQLSRYRSAFLSSPDGAVAIVFSAPDDDAGHQRRVEALIEEWRGVWPGATARLEFPNP